MTKHNKTRLKQIHNSISTRHTTYDFSHAYTSISEAIQYTSSHLTKIMGIRTLSVLFLQEDKKEIGRVRRITESVK